MCDTLVGVGEATADGSVILAKNSDRQPNEAQALVQIPRARHEPGSTVRCTYIEVPQVLETNEVLLSKPFWIWGCEMGANEHAVAIANEAVFTKMPYEKGPGLIGMDFVRLALERADTACRALEVIVELLETFGQGGNCGFRHREFYHNSFILADPGEAWVLETAGRFWAAEKVRSVRSISNGLTIGNQWDLASDDLVAHAIKRGWCSSRDDFHFARCYSDFMYTTFSACRTRQRRSTQLLEAVMGRITVEAMMAALRDHGPERDNDPFWDPSHNWLMDTLCVHASMGPTRPTQSTCSMVAHLVHDLPTYWLTGASAPCTGLFKPVYLDGTGLPDLGPVPSGVYDPLSLWWSHERLHRSVIRDYATRLPQYRAERDALEAAFMAQAASNRERYVQSADSERSTPLGAFSGTCFEQAAEATAHWTEMVRTVPVHHKPSWLFRRAWDIVDRQAGFPLP